MATKITKQDLRSSLKTKRKIISTPITKAETSRYCIILKKVKKEKKEEEEEEEEKQGRGQGGKGVGWGWGADSVSVYLTYFTHHV